MNNGIGLLNSSFKLILYVVVAAVGRLLDWEQLDWCSWLLAYFVHVGFIVIVFRFSGFMSRNSAFIQS